LWASSAVLTLFIFLRLLDRSFFRDDVMGEICGASAASTDAGRLG
jgi:hypothetical protein